MDQRLPSPDAYGHVFLWRDLITEGIPDRVIAQRVRSGEWKRVRRGAYIDGDRWVELNDLERHARRAHAVARQAKTDIVLSHTSALPAFVPPSWGLDLSTVHVTRPDQRGGRREAGVQQHVGTLLPEDVVDLGSLTVTSATRTVLDVTTVADTEPALVVMNDFLHRGLTNIESISARYAAMSQWPNTLSSDLVIRLADGRLESVGETRSMYMCWRQGLPAPVPQYPIVDGRGRIVAYVDFAWPEHGVFLEFDGKVKYSAMLREGETAADVVVREKRREELICEITGWPCIRIIWADLMRPEHTAMRIRRLLFPGASAA